ncbi:protein kinase [Streptomyces sp. NPDC089799]|uniref:protein kinase domain-containing protein n=1 Tax=Streptomyces sp. NPDC089799 TaxID=3155066 RepID=UPI003431A73D
MHIGPDSAPDRYRLLRSIGRGGEAVLYLAEIELAGGVEPVVVKVLDSKTTITPDVFGRVSRKWNEQAELLRFVHRPGVVGVREHFEGPPIHRKGEGDTLSGRALVLVMNHVDGLDLRDWRAERTLATPAERREVMRTLEQLADVLDWLHSGRATPSGRTVIHGDLSPGNVMVDAHGQATLVDFGLSKLTADHQTAEVWFTPGYAAPEVFEGKRTPGTDRYAFGAIAHFLLSGESPPPAPGQLAAAFTALPQIAILDEERRKRIVEICASDPEARPATLSSWMKDLRHAVVSTTTSGTRSRPAVSDAVPPGFVPPPPASAPRVPPMPAGLPAETPKPPASAPTAAAAGSVPAAAPVAPPTVNPPVVPPTPPPAAPAPVHQSSGPQPSAPQPSGPPAPEPHAPTAPAPSPDSGPGPSAPTPAAPAGFGPPPGGSPYGPAASSPYPPTYGPGPAGPSGPTATPTSAASPTVALGQVPSGGPKPKKKRGKLILASALTVLLIAAGAVAAAAVLSDRNKDKDDQGSGDKPVGPTASHAPKTPSSTPEPSDTVSEGPASGSPAPSGSGSGSPSPGRTPGPGPNSISLTTLNPVAKGQYAHLGVGHGTIKAKYYETALVPDGGDEECNGSSEYNLSMEWNTLTLVAGIDDSSPNKSARVTISVDGKALYTGEVNLGAPESLNLKLDSGLRLSISYADPGGGCKMGNLVLGDPVLSK